MSRHKRSRSDLGTASKTNPFKAPKLGKPQPLPQRGNPSLNRAQTTKNVFATKSTRDIKKTSERVKKYENELDNIGNQVHRVGVNKNYKSDANTNKRQRQKHAKRPLFGRNANKKKQTKVNKQTDVSSLKRANRTHIKRGQSIQRIVVTPKTKDAKSSAGTKASKSQIQSMSRHKRSRSDLGTASKTNPFKAPKLGKPQPLPQRGNPSLNRAQNKTNPFKAPKRGKPQALPQRGTPSLNRAQTTKNVFATKKTHHKSTSTTFVLGTINPSSMASPPINQILIHFDHDEQFIEQRKRAFASHNHKVSERVNKYENELDNIGNQVHRVGVNKNYKSDANTNKRQRQKHAKKPLFGRPLSALQETRDAHKSKRTNKPTLQRSTSSKNVHSQPTKTYKTNTQNTTKSPGNRTRARQFADKVGSRY
eukprot:476556_1